MARKADLPVRKRLSHKHGVSPLRSENQGMAVWERPECNYHSGKNEMLGTLCSCQSNTVRAQVGKTSSQQSQDSSELSEAISVFHSHGQRERVKSSFGGNWQRQRTITHWNNISKLFTKLTISLVLLLSVCSSSSLASDLPWDQWSIEDASTAADSSKGRSSTLNVPDLVAVSGHLFQYHIPASVMDSSSLHYQAREAGRDKLPDWLSLNSDSGTLTGVPLEKDKGKWYITLNLYTSKGSRSVLVSETLFSIAVVGQIVSAPQTATDPMLAPLNRTNCFETFHLSQEAVPSYLLCLDGSSPVIASLVTYPSMETLSSDARADILVSLSESLEVCPHSLVVDNIGWSSVERMKLWSQLVESGMTEYIDSTSTVSLILSCSISHYKSQSVDVVLHRLEQHFSKQSEETEAGLILKWFVSRGANVLEKSALAVVPDNVHHRLRREIFDLEDLPIIEVTTTSPELVSSSSTTQSSSSQPQNEASTNSAIDGRVISTSSASNATSTNMLTSVGFSSANVPTATSGKLDTADVEPSATYGGDSPTGVPSPTSSGFSATDASIATAMDVGMTNLPLATTGGFSTTDLLLETLTGVIDSLPSTSVMLPLSRVVPSPTNTAGLSSSPTNTAGLSSSPTNTAGLSSQLSVVSSAAPTSSQFVAPSSRVVPSSETTLVLTPSSLPSTTQPLQPQLRPSSLPRASSEQGPRLAVSSIPVMSLMFSVPSLLTSLPVLSESLSPTPSAPPSSRFFTIQSSIDDLRTQTPALSTFSLSLSSLSPLVSSSEVILMPEATTPLLSLSATFSLRPTTSQVSPLVPVSSSDNILLPDTSTLIQTDSVSLVLTTSAEPTSTVLTLSPTATIPPEFSSRILMQETSIVEPVTSEVDFSGSEILLPTIEPTPSLSSEPLTAPMPDSTVFSSPLVQSSSNNMLMPMSSSELTLSISIFTPTPAPSLFPTVSSSMDVLPFPSSSPIFTASVDASTSDIISSSIVGVFTSDIFPPEISSGVVASPTTSFSVSSTGLFTSSTAPPSSSEEIVFPEPTTIFVSPTPSPPLPSSSEEIVLTAFVSPTLSLPNSTSFAFTIMPTVTLSSEAVLIPSSEIALSSIDPFPPSSSVEISALSSIDLFPPSSSVAVTSEVFSTQTEAMTLESTTVELPLTTFELTQTIAFSQSLDLTENITPETTLAQPTVVVPSVTPSRPTTLSPPQTQETPSTQAPSTAISSSFLSLPPSPSPSPTSSPIPTFCEVNNIDCGKGVCLNDSDIDTASLSFCDCFPDYTGISCSDKIDDCTPPLCDEDGTSLCIDGNATFTCICHEGYTGELCDELLNGCLSSPCHSLATCVDMGMGHFNCLCPVGYSGVLCQDDIDPCEPNPCRENETCEAVDAQNFTCSGMTVTNSTSSTLVPQSVSQSIAPSSAVSSLFFTASSNTSVLSSLSSSLSTRNTSSSVISETSRTLSSPLVQSISTTMTPSSMISTTPVPSPSLTPSPPVSNQSPLLLNPIGTLIVNRGQIFRFSVPEDTFHDKESGSTGSLSLTLLSYSGDQLPNTTWVQVNQGNIEGLPLSSEITNEAITDHLFILQARDDLGNSAHDFITIRVLPLGPFSTLLTVLFENEFDVLSQNVTQRIDLVQRLSSSAISSEALRKRQLELPSQMYSPEEIFIREFIDTSPLAVSYKNLSIPDLNCAEFYDWIENIYNFTSNEYTARFLEVMEPDFHPTPTPRIEGICRLTTSNIPPTVSEVEIDVSDSDISHRLILLSTLVPAACLALCCLLLGLCALYLYRRKRSERKYCTSRRLYLNRRPIILEGEADFPERRGRPVILENDLALRGDSDEDDEYSSASSDFSLIPPAEGERERLVRDPSVPPPDYRLPPLYTHGQLYDFSHDR